MAQIISGMIITVSLYAVRTASITKTELECATSIMHTGAQKHGSVQMVRGDAKMIDIRKDVDGLWCDDITFCQKKCGWKECPRNKLNIRDKTVPHSFSVETPSDCPKNIKMTFHNGL